MLDKKALRKFAAGNPAPAIPPGHGLLRASQVDYIVRTAVRIIGRRRTLVLYVYDRAKAADGDCTPVWTMFQAGEDYITLARREDGSACWREAAFERLDRGYRFKDKCTFYSVQDEQRICAYFHDGDHGGIAALIRAQQTILDKRCQERRRRRERRTIDRMRPLHTLPRGLNGWVRREVMPAYFRCEHTSVRRPVTGICTSCRKEFAVPGAAHNGKIICPHCRRDLTVKSVRKVRCLFDRDTVQVIERISDSEVVVRIVKVWYNYGQDCLTPVTRLCENARIFIRHGVDGKVVAEPYYFSYGKGTLTHWMPGERPVFSNYQYNFEADLCGHVFCKGLTDALAGTPWQYCPVEAFYEHFHEPMQMWPFLAAHLEHPRLEHLVKVGFFNLACDLAYRGDYGHALDEAQNRTHRILRVAPEDVAFLRELDMDMGTLEVFQGYASMKDRQRLLRWQLEHNVTRDIDHLLEHMAPQKFMKYMDGQYAALRLDGGGGRYNTMQYAVSEYRDYLDMCVKLGYDLGNSFMLYPKDLREAHDGVQGRIKAKADAQMRQDFEDVIQAISGHLDFEMGGMKVVLPATPEEIIAEGHALHHCVGSYVDRVTRKECVILFLRRCEDIDKPFYTVEVRGGKIVQLRGMSNCTATSEVEKFMDKWERQVLRRQGMADAA